jgi:hypothetical protein
MAIFPSRRAFLSGAVTSFLAQPGRAAAQAVPVPADASAFVQAGAGAVPRSVQDKLREIEVNVNDFGAIPNDRSRAADNHLAIRRALRHVLTQAPAPHLEGQLKLNFGAGEYFIAGHSPLMFNRSEMAGLAGGYRHRRGLKYQGSGRKSTILTLVSDGDGDRWFYSTEDRNSPGDTSVADWLEFDGITFRGPETLQRQAAGSRTNGFYWESYGWEKFINFSNCTFEHLDTCLQVEGDGNVDHNCFTACNFLGIRHCLLYLNNNQSIAWKFLGCDAEAILARRRPGDQAVRAGIDADARETIDALGPRLRRPRRGGEGQEKGNGDRKIATGHRLPIRRSLRRCHPCRPGRGAPPPPALPSPAGFRRAAPRSPHRRSRPRSGPRRRWR